MTEPIGTSPLALVVDDDSKAVPSAEFTRQLGENRRMTA